MGDKIIQGSVEVVGGQLTDEELRSIDLTELEKEASKIFGVKVSFTDKQITRSGKYFRLSTGNLKKKTGVLADHYKEFYIVVRLEYALHQGQNVYWGNAGFDFEWEGGGHNGRDVANVLYNADTDKWEIAKR